MAPVLLLLAAISVGSPSASSPGGSQDVLLEFSATWCGPCRGMAPILAKLHAEGLPIRQIDVDRNRDLAKHYNIESIPAFVVVVGGREVHRSVGAQSEANVRQMLAMIPPASPPGFPSHLASPEPPYHAPAALTRTVAADIPRAARSAETTLVSAEVPAAPRAPEKRGLLGLPWGRRAAPAAPPVSAAVRAQSPEGAVPRSAREPLESAVRIRVRDGQGVNFGSGTVVACRDDKALVLTCGHIFRGFSASSVIEVDLFPAGPSGPCKTLVARLLARDEEGDVGLIGVAGCGGVALSPIAGTPEAPTQGGHVFSVGCGNGDAPTKLQHVVTGLNIYNGPDTTECDGCPVQGRSGGGLFDTTGRLTGVCIAAQREEQRGVYAGLTVVHTLLKDAGYGYLVPQPVVAEGPAPDSFEAAIAAADSRPTAVTQAADSPDAAFVATTATAPPPASFTPPTRPTPPRFEPAGADRTDTLGGSLGAEVTCIIRRPDDASGRTETIVINRASPKFLRYLRGELDAVPAETSAVVPVGADVRTAMQVHRPALGTAVTLSPTRPIWTTSFRPRTTADLNGYVRVVR